MSVLNLDRSVWRSANWLVMSPHPDDETIGVGSLIAQSAGDGRLAGVIYLNDGTGSHPEGTPRLGCARRAEARTALQRLTGRRVPTVWLGWRDAQPLGPDTLEFAAVAARIGALLRRRRIDAVAVTDAAESHSDHVAAHWLARAAIRRARRSISLFTYSVWSDPDPVPCRGIRTRYMSAGRRRHALHAHRSQLSPLFGDGFRLPREMRSMDGADTLYLRSHR